MRLKLIRYLFEKDYTMGKLYVDDILICDTLEDAYRGDNLTYTKVYGKTCIPCGKYKVITSMSNRFKTLLPEILNVPFFVGIRIHSGNIAEHTDGCILVGKKEKNGVIGNSKDTLRYILNSLTDAKNDDITIDIKIGYY